MPSSVLSLVAARASTSLDIVTVVRTSIGHTRYGVERDVTSEVIRTAGMNFEDGGYSHCDKVRRQIQPSSWSWTRPLVFCLAPSSLILTC